MIVSHEHRFIFFKTIKTAGTSVEIALSRLCGPQDVITPVGGDEALRVSLGGRPAQHYGMPYRSYSVADWTRLVRTRRHALAYNHMHAADVRRMVGARVWRSYLKFTVVRNPWDAVISLWYFKYRDRPEERPSLSVFLNSPQAARMVENYRIFSMDGEVVADTLCRYEDLDAQLSGVCHQIGLPSSVQLPRAKGGTRTDRRSYRDVLTELEAEEIAEKLAPELALTGYTY